MDDKKLIWVKAIARGQLANRMWVDEDSPPFQVEDGKESKRWMKTLTETEAKKLTAKLNDGVDDEVSASDLAAITEERDELAGKVESLEANLKAMKDELDKLKARPAASVAGAKKD